MVYSGMEVSGVFLVSVSGLEFTRWPQRRGLDTAFIRKAEIFYHPVEIRSARVFDFVVVVFTFVC